MIGAVIAVVTRHAWIGFLLLSAGLGYLLVWERGLYIDDYFFGVAPLNDPTLHGGLRPFAMLMLTSISRWVVDYELAIRVAQALLAVINAGLFGWLAYRLLRARWAGIAGAWLLALPLFASEAILWTNAALYPVAVLFMLLTLHAFYSLLHTATQQTSWGVVALVMFTISLLFHELVVIVPLLLPLLALIAAFGRPGARRRFPRYTLIVATALIAISGLVYLSLYNANAFVAPRGSVNFSLTNLFQARIPTFLERLVWLTVGPEWGQGYFAEGFWLGARELAATPTGVALLLITAVVLAATVIMWPGRSGDLDAGIGVGVLVALLGVVWFLGGLLIPGVLVEAQILEYRMLYVPFAGLILAALALIWLILKALNGTPAALLVERLALLAAGVIVIAAAVTTLGYARAYTARADLNTRQLTTFTRTFPDHVLPDELVLVPVGFDRTLFDQTPRINRLFFGVFDNRENLVAYLSAQYNYAGFTLIEGDYWWGVTLQTLPNGESVQIGPARTDLSLDDAEPLPLRQVLPITYREGQMFAVRRWTPHDSETSIGFPVAADLSALGIPVIDLISD
ncbi:MAG: glycosyltransferase family 39 protein [Chloroflexi bacterium]|nr:glycosyltransferase family 39 protein [Chloroflexota bacterium]